MYMMEVNASAGAIAAKLFKPGTTAHAYGVGLFLFGMVIFVMVPVYVVLDAST
jgi:hypothetical protein